MHDPHYAYRPDLDGLRAVAVTSVVAFHAFPGLVTGGFVGVDLFFVISGFLITGILRRELADATFSITAFYARRVRRLFPALAVVLAVTLAGGWAILLADEFRQLGRHTAAGAGFAANLALWAETDYFDAAAELKPLLHLWSGPPPTVVRAALAAVAGVLAWATYRYVERPLQALGKDAHRSPAVVTGLATVVLALFLVGVLVNDGLPRERLKSLSAVLSEARRDWDYPGDEHAVLAGIPDETVLLFGDSYVQQLYPRLAALAALHEREQRRVIFHTAGGCAPVPVIARKTDPRCLAYATSGFERAAAPAVKVVVIGGSWLGMMHRGDYYAADDPARRIIDFSDPRRLDAVLGRLEQELARLTGLGKAVYVILNPPGGAAADPGAFAGGRGGDGQHLAVKSITFTQYLLRTAVINEPLRAVAQRAGASVIDPAAWLCAAGRCAFTDAQGIPYFKDATHLRASFVRCCVSDFDRLVIPE